MGKHADGVLRGDALMRTIHLAQLRLRGVTDRRPIVECSILGLDFELLFQYLNRAADAQQSLVKRCSLYRIGPSIWTAYALFSRRKRALWEINQKYRVLIANTQPAIAEMHRYLKAHR